MKVECTEYGMRIIPENYQDKQYLIYFFRDACEEGVDKNMDLLFEKEFDNGKHAGGSCSIGEISEFFDMEQPTKPWLPIYTDEIECLEILSSEV